MGLTKCTYTAYKTSGKFIETRTYNCEIDAWNTDSLVEYLYNKHPKLKKMNFTIEAWQDSCFNSRLVLNDIVNIN